MPTSKRDANIKVISYQSNDYTYLGFNLSSEKLQDKRVRQAMSLAVDRDMIIDYVYNGEATVSTFVAPGHGSLGMGRREGIPAVHAEHRRSPQADGRSRLLQG